MVVMGLGRGYFVSNFPYGFGIEAKEQQNWNLVVGFGNGCFERTSLIDSFPNCGGGEKERVSVVVQANEWRWWCE